MADLQVKVNQKGIGSTITHLNNLMGKFEGVIEDMVDEGTTHAKLEVESLDAVYTGELVGSIFGFPGKRIGVISAEGNDHAAYVEFGTGIVGSNQPHSEASKHGWSYDINSHGEKGWVYFNDKDNQYHRTSGYRSRPFMYNTRVYLQSKLQSFIDKRFKSK